MNYRREIDGLRAVAVLPVILFHAGFSVFSGGFLGVDVFFVISGYLITRHILEELANGHFSLRRFYARRARRILPALFVVMLLSIPFAFLWLLPSQYADFSRSLIAVPLFVSNLFFWRESGYYAAEAAEKPLLHTWSLGVEEQYYLLFPLALMLLWRFGRSRAFYGVVLAAILSLALCEYASRAVPIANFFLIPTRAWELLAGSICAFLHQRRAIKGNGPLAALGLGLILFAMVQYDEGMRLPSLGTLVPVLGAALVLLYAGADTLTSRLLSTRGMVGIGLISYSLYLWHYPLFAFAHLQFVAASTGTMTVLVAASLVLGTLTWRYVEQPFRRQTHPRYVADRRALMLLGTMLGILFAAGLYGYASHGRLALWTAHASPNQVRALQLLEAEQPPRFYDNGDCVFMANMVNDVIEARLAACHKKYGPGIAIIGDSHAMNLLFELRPQAMHHPFMAALAQGGCRPHTPAANCYYDALRDFLATHPGIFRNIIYEQAGFYLFQVPRGHDADRATFADLPIDTPVPDFVPHTRYIDRVAAYLSSLAPYSRVTWLGPRVEPLIRRNTMIHLGCDYAFHLRPNQQQLYQKLDDAIRDAAAHSPIHYRSQMDMVQLDMARDFISCDTTYWKDGDHYSAEGEIRFGKRIPLQSLLKDTPRQ